MGGIEMTNTATQESSSVPGPQGCPSPDCDITKIERVDVFCHSHEQFMPLARAPGLLRTAILLGWAAAICWMFLLSVQLHSAIPVFLAAASIGIAVATLPLRFFPVAWV